MYRFATMLFDAFFGRTCAPTRSVLPAARAKPARTGTLYAGVAF